MDANASGSEQVKRKIKKIFNGFRMSIKNETNWQNSLSNVPESEQINQDSSTIKIRMENDNVKPDQEAILTITNKENKKRIVNKKVCVLLNDCIFATTWAKHCETVNLKELQLISDLSIAEVKDFKHKRFYLYTPQLTYKFEFESKSLCSCWFEALKASIGNKKTYNYIPTKDQKNIIMDSQKHESLRNIKGCDRCADCDAPNPQWVEAKHGITLCITCSGIHRGLGVQYSRIKSLTMDKLSKLFFIILSQLGNDVCNKIYRPKSLPKKDELFQIALKDFIYKKYVDNDNILELKNAALLIKPPITDIYDKFLQHCNENNPSLALYEAVKLNSLPLMLLSLAQGANIDIKCPYENNYTPLHYSALKNYPIAMGLLIANEADPDILDNEGNTPLHLTAISDSPICACLLLMRKNNISVLNNNGKTALILAIDNLAVDTVVVLKVALMSFEFGDINLLEEKVQGNLIAWINKNYPEFDENMSEDKKNKLNKSKSLIDNLY